MGIVTLETLKALKPKTTEIDCPELGGTFRVRMLGGADRMRLGDLARKHSGDTERLVREILSATLIDEDGKRLFSNGTVRVLMDADGEAVEKLAEQVQVFCGLGSEAVEDAAKNSETTTS